jgi:MoaA/NifB/PqqE/SkfB family radical SAM enzyme
VGLTGKIKRVNAYYKEHGLSETISAIKSAARIDRRYYPFKYRYPSMIIIETMDVCNLKCSHCYLQAQTRSNKGFMDYNFFEKIVQRLSPVIERANAFAFSSTEGLLHKRIFDMVDLVRERNRDIDIGFDTNGMLLDENRIYNLLKRGIYSYPISLDGCRKETVESFKTGVDFDRVVGNIKKLKEIRENGENRIRIHVNFVAHKGNIGELLDYVDFCESLGVDRIQILGFISYTPEMRDQCLYSRSGIREVDELFQKAAAKAKAAGMRLIYHSTRLEPVGCRNASGIMNIDIEGNIVPCHLFSQKTSLALLDKFGTTEQIIWGNVFEQDPYKIWTSKASVDFRRLLHEGKLPKECALCAAGHNVIC